MRAPPTPALRVLWAPLWERFKLGEGALLAVNAACVAFAAPPPGAAAAQLAVSLAGLALLYAYNDVHDAPSDRRNPKKNPGLVEDLAVHRERLFWHLRLWMAAASALALALLGPAVALRLAALFGVNALYSRLLKGTPGVDLAVVGVWGFLYAGLVDPPWRIALLVGAMTAVMHVFQTLVDREVDAANRVTTTAVHSRGAALGGLAAGCAVLALVLLPLLGPAAALSGFAPLALALAVRRPGIAWMASRLYCAVALLAALRVLHGVS